MSTILKALKQVDQTAPPEDLQSWPPQIDTKETVKARVEKIRLNRKVYLTIVLVLIIVAAAWLVYNQKDLLLAKLSSGRALAKDKLTSSASSENGPVYHAKIYPPASKQTVSSAKRDSAPNMGNQRAGLKYEPKQTGNDKQSRQLPKIPVRKNIIKSQDFTTSGQTRPLPKPAPSKSRISRSQLADPKKPVRNQGRAAVTSPTKKAKSPLKQVSRSYRRLDDSKLKLQAIAWSDDPAQRIAVINNHVVREGESVEGFSVTQIRQDDIIVNDGTESWRLEFGLK
ncbi:MAG: general secretion pathway protein GspB [Desulfobacterales bacterium]